MGWKTDRKCNMNEKKPAAALPGTIAVVLALLMMLSALPVYGAQKKEEYPVSITQNSGRGLNPGSPAAVFNEKSTVNTAAESAAQSKKTENKSNTSSTSETSGTSSSEQSKKTENKSNTSSTSETSGTSSSEQSKKTENKSNTSSTSKNSDTSSSEQSKKSEEKSDAANTSEQAEENASSSGAKKSDAKPKPGSLSSYLENLRLSFEKKLSGGTDKALSGEDSAEGSSAGQGNNTEKALKDGTFYRVRLAGEPENPVPAGAMDLDTASLLGLVSEGLTALDRYGGVVPGCAEKWTISKDGLSWTFNLRKDLCWSDGKSFDADYFENLFKKIANPATETPYGQDLVKNIAGYDEVRKGKTGALKVTAKDDRTLVIRFSSPDPEFARKCASLTLLPLRDNKAKNAKASSVSSWGDVTGNGPYRIVHYDKRNEILLEKNPYYENEERGVPLEKIQWKISGDRNQEYSDLLNGDFDALADIPPEEKADLLKAEDTDHAFSEQIIPDVTGILFNCRRDLLSSDDVRRALCMIIDREYIASGILKNVFIPADGLCWFEGQHSTEVSADADSDNEKAKDYPSGSLKEAKKLLEEAYGSKKSLPSLTILADENGAVPEVAEYIATLWRDLGFEVSVKTAAADKIAEKKAEGKYDVICTNLLLPSDLPSTELGKFTAESTDNVTGFSNGKYDSLIQEAMQEKDQKKVDSLLREAAEILTQKLPVAPLVIRSVSWINRRVDGQEAGEVFCDPSGRWQLWVKAAENTDPEKNPEKNDESAGTGTGTSDGKQGETADESLKIAADGSGTGAEESTDGQSADDGKKGLSLFKNNKKKTNWLWGQKKQSDDVQTDNEKKKSPESVSLFGRFFDVIRYFSKSDTKAWLTRQAYILEGTGKKEKKIISLPKYTQVRLTGTGNEYYVRISRLGKFQYLEADRVTTDREEIDNLKKKEKKEKLWARVASQTLNHVKKSELALRAEEIREETEKIREEIAQREVLRKQTSNPSWNGPVLSRGNGSVTGPSGKETYYNLDMSGVVNIMRGLGYNYEYWVRDDGCKMLGNYIMCAANLSVHPRGTLVETSLGTCIVCDTGGFASHNSNQIDIAVTW